MMGSLLERFSVPISSKYTKKEHKMELYNSIKEFSDLFINQQMQHCTDRQITYNKYK